MRRKILGAMLPFVAGLLGGGLARPVILEAQHLASTLMAQSVTAEFMRVVGADFLGTGADRIQMGTQWDGQGADIRLVGPDGQTPRLIISSGGINVPDPDGSGLQIHNQSGIPVARLGMGHGPQGTQPLTNLLFLTDQDGHRRILLSVDQYGTPSIKLLDAQGNITWRAP